MTVSNSRAIVPANSNGHQAPTAATATSLTTSTNEVDNKFKIKPYTHVYESIPKDATIIQPRRKKHSLVDFMMMTIDEVLGLFATLPNAERVGKGDQQFVY